MVVPPGSRVNQFTRYISVAGGVDGATDNGDDEQDEGCDGEPRGGFD